MHECKKIGDGWRLTGFAFVIEVVPLARYETVGCGTAIVFVAAIWPFFEPCTIVGCFGFRCFGL